MRLRAQPPSWLMASTNDERREAWSLKTRLYATVRRPGAG
jgi:hypothetical protein